MQQQEIHEFLTTYFQANDCELLENTPSYLTVQLTNEMDKELMNRPFYWHYLEKTGGIPNPAQMTIITDQESTPDSIKGENIHVGSPRLHQLIESTKRLAGYIRVYEDIFPVNGQLPLFPWLALNVKISYQCDRKKETFMSVGLNLISGEIMEDFHKKQEAIKVTSKIPDYTFTLSPLIMPKSGLGRLESYIKKSFEQDDHSWADKARERWQADLELLEHFYKDMEEKSESYHTEKKALQSQYEPMVIISVINGGLFYLSEGALR